MTSAKNIRMQKLFLYVCCFLRFDHASVRFLFWDALGSYKKGFVKSRSQIKFSKIGRMSNHDVFALGWAQNPFLISNLDHKSKFQKSAECQIMMILICTRLRIHLEPFFLIAYQNFKNWPNIES